MKVGRKTCRSGAVWSGLISGDLCWWRAGLNEVWVLPGGSGSLPGFKCLPDLTTAAWPLLETKNIRLQPAESHNELSLGHQHLRITQMHMSNSPHTESVCPTASPALVFMKRTSVTGLAAQILSNNSCSNCVDVRQNGARAH